MLSETCFEIDFNFSDVLSSISDSGSVISQKNTNSNGNLNSFNFSFSVNSTPDYKSTSVVENGALDDDLSALLDSCHVQKHRSSDITSLASLANDYLSNNFTSGKKPEQSPSGLFVSNVKNEVSDEILLLDCLEDILLEEKYEDHKQNLCPEKLLDTLQWEQSSVKDYKMCKRNHILEPSKETVEDENIPDINLNFCIKKNKKDKFSPMSESPESSDSGFGEMDFSSDKSDSYSSVETSSLETTFGSSNLIKPSLISSKQSLLSRAISAQPRTGESKREKLRNIQKELLRKFIPEAVFEYKQDQHLEEYENFIDQSAQCVIKSNFLTITGQ